ncbi:hypothetical protein MKL42_09460 [Acinetobacter sp. AOR15_HL]|nr:hypothetical protein [Acinetobacter sp. AOR15_HL]MDA3557719.1 hypothetical protein [Acinetobacter sp. AOR15_HL]
MKPHKSEYTEHYLGQNGEKCISIVFDDISKSAVIPVDQISYGKETTDFYKSICRKAKLMIKQLPDMDQIEQEITIADPNFVEIIPMPKNGKIKKKVGCGYSI